MGKRTFSFLQLDRLSGTYGRFRVFICTAANNFKRRASFENDQAVEVQNNAALNSSKTLSLFTKQEIYFM
jgi:hypothetical protein